MNLVSRGYMPNKSDRLVDSIFCLDVLVIALEDGTPCIFNTDQGCQFTSSDFTGRLLAEQILISMDGRTPAEVHWSSLLISAAKLSNDWGPPHFLPFCAAI